MSRTLPERAVLSRLVVQKSRVAETSSRLMPQSQSPARSSVVGLFEVFEESMQCLKNECQPLRCVNVKIKSGSFRL